MADGSTRFDQARADEVSGRFDDGVTVDGHAPVALIHRVVVSVGFHEPVCLSDGRCKLCTQPVSRLRVEEGPHWPVREARAFAVF
jgi:hypothetical protein